MKKAACTVMFLLLLLLLCSCQTEEPSKMENTVTFINTVTEADVWILPQTARNLKTTVWGTATAEKVKTGESRKAALCEPGNDGLYIFRMIDTDGFYYSANGISLKADRQLRIKESDTHEFSLEVTDSNGVLQNTYDVFAAKL